MSTNLKNLLRRAVALPHRLRKTGGEGASASPSLLAQNLEWARTWAPSTWRSDQLGKEGANEYDELRVFAPIQGANLAGSAIDETLTMHQLVLDVDHPVEIVRSTNSADHGGGHLYVRLPRPVTWEKYLAFLEASANIGLISRNYLRHSKIRKMTCLRLPWVAKPPRGGIQSADADDALR